MPEKVELYGCGTGGQILQVSSKEAEMPLGPLALGKQCVAFPEDQGVLMEVQGQVRPGLTWPGLSRPCWKQSLVLPFARYQLRISD